MKALSQSEDPNRASIPFDKERSGFVLGEGAGILLLEELSHARSGAPRSTPRLVGYGATCDAYHMTAPRPGRLRCRQGHGHGRSGRRYRTGSGGLYQRPRHLHSPQRRR